MRLGIYVISLQASVQRRAEMQRQLSALGLAFEFVDSVDGRQLPDSAMAAANQARAERFPRDRPLTSGEVGCALGHRQAYESIDRHGLDGAIVLEDDVLLTPALGEFAQWLAARPPHGDWSASIFWLGGAEGIGGQEFLVTSLWRRIAHGRGRLARMVRSEKFVIRACGYFIGKGAAGKICRFNAAPVTVADDWKNFYRAGLLQDIYIAQQPLLHHPVDLQGSLLEPERKVADEHEPPMKLFASPRRAIRPAKAALRRIWRQLYRVLP